MRRRLLLLVALAAASCGHDFRLPALAGLEIAGLEVSPPRVGPGARLRIQFETSASSVAVTVNGRPAVRESVAGSRHLFGYGVTGDEGEVLNVDVRAELAGEVRGEQVQVTLDARAPEAPDLARLVLEQNPPGEPDWLSALAGVVAASDAAALEVAVDPGATLVLARLPLAGDRSAEPADLGDNAAARLYVFALDDVGNRSPPTALANDVAGPLLQQVDAAPRQPRAGRRFEVVLRFDEPLASSPRVRLANEAAALETTGAPSGDGGWRAVFEVALSAGPARLEVQAEDAAGNPSLSQRTIEVLPPDVIDPARIALRRLSAGATQWRVGGLSGAVPVGALVEARTREPGGVETSWGVCFAGFDGSFSALLIERDLGAEDEVLLVASDDGGAEIARAVVRPDLRPPALLGVEVSPPLAGPDTLVQIALEADEPLGPATRVRLNGRDANASGFAGHTARFEYFVVGDEPSGTVAIAIEAADLAGNLTRDSSHGVTLDLTAARVELQADGASWQEPPDPPYEAVAPAQIAVAVSDPESGVAGGGWSLTNVRTGARWDGAAWAAAGAPIEFPLDAFGRAQTAVSGAMLPELERIRMRVRTRNGVGLESQRTEHFARYSRPRFSLAYPALAPLLSQDPQNLPTGETLALARVGEHGICAVGMTWADFQNGGALQLLWSPDGGQSWSQRPIPGVTLTELEPLPWRLQFDPQGQQGLILGSRGLIVRLDATCNAVEVVDAGLGDWTCQAAWDGATTWMATYEGVFRSEDGGSHWTPVDVGAQVAFSGIATLAPGRLLAVGDAGTIVASDDGGASWALQDPWTVQPLWDLAVTPGGIVYVSGRGTVALSRDGRSWVPLPAVDIPTPGLVASSVEGYFVRAAGEEPVVRFDYEFVENGSRVFAMGWFRYSTTAPGWSRVFSSHPYRALGSVFYLWDYAPFDAYSAFYGGLAYAWRHQPGRFNLLLWSNTGGE